MARINHRGYVERTTSRGVERDWYFIKASERSNPRIEIKYISFPKHMEGKKVMIKVIFLEDKERRI